MDWATTTTRTIKPETLELMRTIDDKIWEDFLEQERSLMTDLGIPLTILQHPPSNAVNTSEVKSLTAQAFNQLPPGIKEKVLHQELKYPDTPYLKTPSSLN